MKKLKLNILSLMTMMVVTLCISIACGTDPAVSQTGAPTEPTPSRSPTEEIRLDESPTPDEPALQPTDTPTEIATQEATKEAVDLLPLTCGVPESDSNVAARARFTIGDGLSRDDLQDASMINMQPMLIEDAANRGAVCNDGSAAGFYYLPSPLEDGSNRWVIHLSGGGFCENEENCETRSVNSPRRISSLQGRQFGEGVLSPLLLENPDFYDANHIYVHYCSSDFWSGTREAAEITNGYHFKGRTILSALIEDLVAQTVSELPTITNATEVLLTGSSAGGVGVMANLDWFAQQLPSATVCGVNDAGVFFDVESYTGSFDLTSALADGYEYWQAALDDDCVAANVGQEHVCFFSSELRTHLSTPIFLQLAQKDPNYLERLGIDDPDSAEQQAYIEEFVTSVRDTMNLYPAGFSKFRNLANHGTLTRQLFQTRTIDNIPLYDVIGNWYFEREGPKLLIEE